MTLTQPKRLGLSCQIMAFYLRVKKKEEIHLPTNGFDAIVVLVFWNGVKFNAWLWQLMFQGNVWNIYIVIAIFSILQIPPQYLNYLYAPVKGINIFVVFFCVESKSDISKKFYIHFQKMGYNGLKIASRFRKYLEKY